MPRRTRASARPRCAAASPRRRAQGDDALQRQARHRQHEVKITDRTLKRIVSQLPGTARPDAVPICQRRRRAAADHLERRQRLYPRGDRRRLHRQAFPHLGRERDRVRPDARQGRERADQRQDGGRAGRRSARQHVGDEPQGLCPPGADRGGQGRPRDPLDGLERPRARKWLSSCEVALLQFLDKVAGKRQRKRPLDCGRRVPPRASAMGAWHPLHRTGCRGSIATGCCSALAVGAALVAVMLAAPDLRPARRRAASPTGIGWRSVIGRVLAKTSLAFMVVAAADIVATYAEPAAASRRISSTSSSPSPSRCRARSGAAS